MKHVLKADTQSSADLDLEALVRRYQFVTRN
jgi:hypothetical protein